MAAAQNNSAVGDNSITLNDHSTSINIIYYKCCEPHFFLHIIIIVMLVMFAGMMSGLTLGLMSMSLVDLQVLAMSGTPRDRLHASKILSIAKGQHLLLCTLLLSNAAAMEALPLFLDALVPDWGAILISVTLVLFFGEIIPQSVCTRYGLVIGAALAPIVRVLVWICFPVAYPISKLLDFLLGKDHVTLFCRSELKTLVDFHGDEAGKGGELSRHETTIIAGALELTGKTTRDAMTPISETFAVDINSKLDRSLLHHILETGHSRVPVYYEQPKNIVGLILVKNLMTIIRTDEVPIKDVPIRRIPRVSEKMPLYDILNEFQKGHSHMAVVIRQQSGTMKPSASKPSIDAMKVNSVVVDIHDGSHPQQRDLKNKIGLNKLKGLSTRRDASRRETTKSRSWSKNFQPDFLLLDDNSFNQEEEVTGIITMEDVIEELLKGEIYDETDHRHGY